jgi:hypothetical protein
VIDAVQHAGDTLDYAVDWAPFLATTDGDTITEAALAGVQPATDPPLEVNDAGLAGAFHVYWVSGGAPGRYYNVWSRITTTQGRTRYQRVTFLIKASPEGS